MELAEAEVEDEPAGEPGAAKAEREIPLMRFDVGLRALCVCLRGELGFLDDGIRGVKASASRSPRSDARNASSTVGAISGEVSQEEGTDSMWCSLWSTEGMLGVFRVVGGPRR